MVADRHPRRAVAPPARPGFVGRGAARADLAALLARHRMVTVVGPGGCGKTSLAAVVAAGAVEARNDLAVAWVELAAVSGPANLPAAVLDAVGVTDTRGLEPVPRIADYLGERRWLLVLDNCEQFAGAAAKVATALLASCPGLVVLATSRERLDVTDEYVWEPPVLTMPAPDEADPAAVLATDAGRLFAGRAAETC